MTHFDSRYQQETPAPYEGLSAVNGLIVDGAYLDGSWELCVHVEDINDFVSVRVRGDTSVGGLMHQVVEAVNVKQSWSDHAIWWPQRNMWLLHTRTSLDQYGVQSDAQLVFRHMHGHLQLVLPSLAVVTLRVNFASRVFTVVDNICKELCIRHPEELSLMFPVTKETIKYNQPLPIIRHGVKRGGFVSPMGAARADLPAAITTANGVNKAMSLNRLNDSNPYPTLPYGSATLMRGQSDNSLDEERIDINKFVDCSQKRSAKSVFAEEWLLKPKNVQQKARMDGGWLDSSRSLMEHGITPPPAASVGEYPGSPAKQPTLYLRFKFYNFYDLNTNYDAVRIHQIYEQARWSLLSGTLECTEDEMIIFAAYQLQAELQNDLAIRASAAIYSGATLARYNTLGGYNTLASMGDPGFRPLSPDFSSPRSFGGSLLRMPSLGTVTQTPKRSLSPFISSNGHISGFDDSLNEVDEIDVMLSELEQSCNISGNQPKKSKSVVSRDLVDRETAPALQDTLKVFRDKGLLLRRYKEMWVVVRGSFLVVYRDPHNADTPTASYNLRDCLITPDLSPENARFGLKLSVIANSVSSSTSTPVSCRKNRTREDVWLRFNSMDQYAKWLAAFRLLGRGKSLGNRNVFDAEVKLVKENLEKQAAPHSTPVLSPEELNTHLGDLSDFCAERIIKKLKNRESLKQKISEAHAGVRDLSLLDAKLRYIEEWQRLNHFGRSYCIVQFDKGNPFGLGGSGGGLFSSPGPQEDIIAIRQGRIEVVSSTNEETQLAWNFADLRSWNVNWDNGRVILEFRSGKVAFKPLSTNCKTVVELIGGYVFLSQRNPEKNQKLDERLFHKLTGAND